MYKRLSIVSVVVFVTLCALCLFGYYSISLHADGLAGRRQAEFTAVAEQIRIDIKRKFDDFLNTEQARPYTHYQYYFIPQTADQKQVTLRSPLADSLEHGLAYGHFQIEANEEIITPFYRPGQTESTEPEVLSYITNIKNNLLPSLNGTFLLNSSIYISRKPASQPLDKFDTTKDRRLGSYTDSSPETPKKKSPQVSKSQVKGTMGGRAGGLKRSGRGKSYRIESLSDNQETQVLEQSRLNMLRNVSNRAGLQTQDQSQQVAYDYEQAPDTQGLDGEQMDYQDADEYQAQQMYSVQQAQEQNEDLTQLEEQRQIVRPSEGVSRQRSAYSSSEQAQRSIQTGQSVEIEAIQTEAFDSNIRRRGSQLQSQVPTHLRPQSELETVQVRIEPFVPVAIDTDQDTESIIPHQVFLLRHIQIEDQHFRQGFKLNHTALTDLVTESAQNLIRYGMGFELSNSESNIAAYTAVLDFGFGQMMLNLLELNPAWISRQVTQLRTWYLAIISLVLLITAIALASLWRNACTQIKLARKKDDFISAVSHELRTPLTSIRMYTEMLEKNWIKTEDKRAEYYTTMRQESERLSRLIENVLDFSRIQRGRKKYIFKIGNINDCVNNVITMMTPFAQQAGFTIITDFDDLREVAFDADAVMQIVVNLLDNAIKYARNANEKVIIVRTRQQDKYILIEVEDHGPGLPLLQRKKVFEEFYRIGHESTREATGTGLGLALVKKFAQAHKGFVEIISAKPSGVVFRVALAAEI
jgi:signal transduction histidine kinase